MITNVQQRIDAYLADNHHHTLTGLAASLAICPRTLRNVTVGFYKKNMPYGRRERPDRSIANRDFPVVRAAVRQIRRRGG